MNQNMRNATRRALRDGITKARTWPLLALLDAGQTHAEHVHLYAVLSSDDGIVNFSSGPVGFFLRDAREKLTLIAHGNELSLLPYLFLAVDNGGSRAYADATKTERGREGRSAGDIPGDHHQGNWIRHFSNPAPENTGTERSFGLSRRKRIFIPKRLVLSNQIRPFLPLRGSGEWSRATDT